MKFDVPHGAALVALLAQDENPHLECKASDRESLASLVRSVIALKNAGGGHLLLGVAESRAGREASERVVGVSNPDQAASRLVDALGLADARGNISKHVVGGRTIVAATIAGRAEAFPQSGGRDPEAIADTERPRRVLAVATEWLSRHGGLSTFNRELCTALRESGAEVTCLVPAADEADRAHAETAGVRLVVAPSTPGADDLARLFRRPDLGGWEPDVLFGHGRITGPAALSLAHDAFPRARRVHFVHTVAEEIEWYKDRSVGPRSTRAELRGITEADLMRDASLVVGVGPLLTRKARTLLRGVAGSPDVIGLLPGITPLETPDGVPEDVQVLVVGRTEDSSLKGLDVAARALGSLDFTPLAGGRPPTLVVRGAPPADADALRDELIELSGERVPVLVRDYTADRELLQADLLRASLVLMPSRHEGFGLVALEAIGAGVPVLVSDSSGLGEYLVEEGHGRHVVATRGPIDAVTETWARALDRTLFDLSAAFVRAGALRASIGTTMSWRAAADDLLDALAASST